MSNPLNLFDKMVAVFSPEKGLKRLYDRSLLNKYTAALPTDPKTKQKRKFSKSSANELNKGAKAIYERARDGDENNPFVTAILDELCANVVGPNGIMVEPQPLDHKGEVHIEFAQAISKWWELHSLAQNIDNETSRSETEWLACRTWLRDGEVFGRMYMGHHPEISYPSTTPFAIQPFEPQFVPRHITELEGGLIEGIKRNKLGQAISYLIQKDSNGFEFAEVDAMFICHLKFTRRLHQNRGISILHSVLDLISRLESYDNSEMVSAEIASRFAYYIKRDPTLGADNGDAFSRGGDIFLGMGNSFELAPGEDAGIVESNRKESMSAPFRSGQQKLVSSAVGVNNSSVTRNYDGAYSSNRQELVDSYARYRVLQRKFVLNWTRPQYRYALSMAILKGELKIPAGVDASSVYNAIYQAPVMPWIDPKKEMDGIEKGSRLSLFSLSQAQRERNINPLATRKEIQSERKQLNEMGIISTADPAHNIAPVDQIKTNEKGEGVLDA
ncbi:phage portal protein [Vibrio anguillarum]|uniref:Phage portal protein n=1 Tax=Vibrio anguillarum TaxID=55601 RepID=A0ABD4QYJ3_VIBAN|nr:phage portal protein [Vibrio anguillarum]MBT2920159.1 phage portal protein [Vibrio anguillarum]QCW19660.1 portal protein [Vibrio phage Va_90-11-286_p16]